MRTCQNEHNMLLNFPQYLLLQTNKNDNNALYLGQPTDIVIKPPPSARVF
jgi:hypothetical protein